MKPLIIINCKQLVAQFYLHRSKIPPSVAEEIHGVERLQKRGCVRPKLSSDKDAKADAYCEEEEERREDLQNISLLLRTEKLNSQAHQTSKPTRTRVDSDISTGLNYGVSSSSNLSNSISNPKMAITRIRGGPTTTASLQGGLGQAGLHLSPSSKGNTPDSHVTG